MINNGIEIYTYSRGLPTLDFIMMALYLITIRVQVAKGGLWAFTSAFFNVLYIAHIRRLSFPTIILIFVNGGSGDRCGS